MPARALAIVAALLTVVGVATPAAAGERPMHVASGIVGVRIRWDSDPGWLIRVNLRDPRVRLHAMTVGNRLGQVQAMARMARAHHATVAINTDFFRIWDDRTPLNETVVDGQLLESQWGRYAPGSPYSNLMVTGRSAVTIGYAHFNGRVVFPDEHGTIGLAGVNTVETDTTPGGPWTDPFTGHPVLLTSASMVTVHRRLTAVYLRHGPRGWMVRRIRVVGGIAPPRPGYEVLAGDGTAGHALRLHAHIGQVVQVHLSTGGYSQVVGGGPLMVLHGRDVDTRDDRQPPEAKTGAYIDHSGKWLYLVKFQGTSRTGLTRHQFAQWMLHRHAWDGLMFDDGGSAQLVERGITLGAKGWQRHVAEGLGVSE